jgi:hypothetical protein
MSGPTSLAVFVLPVCAFVFAVLWPGPSRRGIFGVTATCGALAGMVLYMWSHEARGLDGIVRALPSVLIGATLGALAGVLGLVARVVGEWLQARESQS